MTNTGTYIRNLFSKSGQDTGRYRAYGLSADLDSVCVYDSVRGFVRPGLRDALKIMQLYMMWSKGSFFSNPAFLTRKFITLLLNPSQPPVTSTNTASSPNQTIEQIAEEWERFNERLTPCCPPHKGLGRELNICSICRSLLSSIIRIKFKSLTRQR